MDTFVKDFFKDFDGPGLPFGPMADGMVRDTFLSGVLKVSDGTVTQVRNLAIQQPMTMLGRTSASIVTSASSLDGLGKPYLTPEGTINLNVVGDTFKSISGMQTAEWSTHVGAMKSWSWADNHVSLMMNALRYILITKSIEEAGSIVNNTLPEFNDGVVRIDRNQWWEGYPQNPDWVMNQWPGGQARAGYPTPTRIVDAHPPNSDNAIDLRGLSGEEARFMFLMAGSWNRRTRMRLDFTLAKLTERLSYRSDLVIPGFVGWLVDAEGEPQVPAPPNSTLAWSALHKYVTKNSLFDHFSTVLYLTSIMMYQFLPQTADGQIWLSFNWRLSLPIFSSVRGRYTFLNEDEAAFGNDRSLQEWSYLGNMLEKINLMATCFVQAIQTGLALRSVRRGLEVKPDDLFTTYYDFYMPHNMLAAAAAEALRRRVPLSGMSGVYVSLEQNFDQYYPDRVIRTLNTDVDDIEGYEVEERAVGTDAAGEEVNAIFVKCPWTTFAGVPVLLMPLNLFNYNSLFNLKGKIEPGMGKVDRRGFRVKAHDAWLISGIYKWAGYDVRFRTNGQEVGALDCVYPDNVHFTWPMLFAPDVQVDYVIITDVEETNDAVFQMPALSSSFFKQQQIDFEAKIWHRGGADYNTTRHRDVVECSYTAMMFAKVNVQFTVSSNVARLRAYITRDEQGFRYVGAVRGGVVPQAAP